MFGLIGQISSSNAAGGQQAGQMVTLLLRFAEKNRGMARVMVGEALVLEHPRLQQRMNLFFDKFESALKQSLRDGALYAATATPTRMRQLRAAILTAFAI